MTLTKRKVWLAALVCGLILGISGVAHGAPSPGSDTPYPSIAKQKSKVWSAAELGFQGTAIGQGVAFLGPVITLQGGHYRPVVGVFQIGLGAALYKDAIPDQVYAAGDVEADPTEKNAMFYVGLGVRVRIFQFLASLRNQPFDLYVGPLAMVFGNQDLVTFGGALELGFAVHLGRVRISFSVHGGYQTVMHQYAYEHENSFQDGYLIGGQASVGLQF